jgi:hypothetical protein
LPSVAEQQLQTPGSVPAKSRSGAADQDQVQAGRIGRYDCACVRKILGAASVDLQGNEIFATDDLERKARQGDFAGPLHRSGIHASQADEQVDAVTKFVGDRQQGRNRVFRIADAQVRAARPTARWAPSTASASRLARTTPCTAAAMAPITA